MAKMTLDQFLAKYALGPNGTFLADDKGGNAASEVAGQNVADYYKKYLAEGAEPRTQQVGGWDSPTDAAFNWGSGKDRITGEQVGLDAWSNVDAHPESNRLDGLGEFWKSVGKPAALMAAAGFGVNALNGLVGAGGSAGIGSGTALGGAEAAAAGDIAALSGNQIAALSPAATGSGFSFAVPEAMNSAVGLDLGGVATTAIPGEAAAAGFSGMGGPGGSAGAAGDFGAGTYSAGSTAGGGGLPGKVTDFVSNPSNLLKIGGTLLGAAGGAAASGDKTTTSSSSRDPWKEAQPYIIDNLKTNANAQEFYRQNPFSDLQKQQYQGLFNNLANSQANVAGLLANASNFGKSNRGVMPAMQGLLSGTQAPAIDWNQYANIGRRG